MTNNCGVIRIKSVALGALRDSIDLNSPKNGELVVRIVISLMTIAKFYKRDEDIEIDTETFKILIQAEKWKSSGMGFGE